MQSRFFGNPERARSHLARVLGGAAEFVRDVVWLTGWGARRLGETAAARPGAARRVLGCLGSAVAVLVGALVWRRRRR